jgi:hypothetical protein
VAVEFNPYVSWVNHRDKADYRCTDTQVNNLVRKQLAQGEYLTRSNRVGPGPERTKRTRTADSSIQIPNVFGSDDLWGWQGWVTKSINFPATDSDVSDSLKETLLDNEVPATSYYPYENVGGFSVGQSYKGIGVQTSQNPNPPQPPPPLPVPQVRIVRWDTSATVIYKGSALEGTGESEDGWTIKRHLFSLSGVLISTTNSVGAWANRTTLTYT